MNDLTMHDNDKRLRHKYIEFENTKHIKQIKELSNELLKAKEILQKTNTKNKLMLLADIENNLKKLTNAYNRLFDVFFNNIEIEPMRNAYIQNNKTITNQAIEEIDKSTKEISKRLSDLCVDESKRLLNENAVDIASTHLNAALLLDIDNAAAYYYLCLISFVNNRLFEALRNITQAIKLGFNKKFCLHYIKIIKNKIN